MIGLQQYCTTFSPEIPMSRENTEHNGTYIELVHIHSSYILVHAICHYLFIRKKKKEVQIFLEEST